MNQKTKKAKRNPFPAEFVNIPVTKCPYCGSERFVKYGKYINTARYRCKECRRTFLPTSGTSIHYINKKEKFLKLFELIKGGEFLTVRRISEKLEISFLTAFNWRNKILAALKIDKEDYKPGKTFKRVDSEPNSANENK